MTKIAIYGIGAFGKLFYEALDKNIDFFIDDFATNKSYDNKPIKKQNEITKDCTIYISVLQHSKMIAESLKTNGFTNVFTFTNAVQKMPKILELISKQNYLWLVAERSKMIDELELAKVKQLLKDKKSKDLLKKIILLRKTLDIKYYIEPSDTEYFPKDVPIFKNLNIVNFIDCGAYIGDTIKELMNQNQQVGYTISFEPDEKNLAKLHLELENQEKLYPKTNFLVYPAGVYSSNTILRFANNGIDSSASFDDHATIQVPVVSLDSIILNANPNFIKMDIEGGEKEALIGAKKTIQKYKPNLAICLYHKPEDLWEIPLMIKQIEPSYAMYLRVHEDMCLSTVLYCISKEIADV